MTDTKQTTGNPRTAKIVSLYPATPDARGFFESVLGFGKMENKWFRVSAQDQRRYFGNVPFGKLAIKVSASGEITTFKTQDFGRDWDFCEWHFDFATKKWLNGENRIECNATLPCMG
jgi:hypothetical protein